MNKQGTATVAATTAAVESEKSERAIIPRSDSSTIFLPRQAARNIAFELRRVAGMLEVLSYDE